MTGEASPTGNGTPPMGARRMSSAAEDQMRIDIADNLDDNILSWFKKRNGDTLKGALAFVPWVLQQTYFEGGMVNNKVVIHEGKGAVVFSDASGFTALTERLAKKSDGAELLSHCLTSFFTPLIDIINAYRGDVIKFSGDALTIYFQAVDDTKSSKYNHVVPPHGTWGLPDLGPMATAVLRASACCIEIHKRLHMFDTGVDNVKLCLHIGVGCGEVHILQVGGVVPPETKSPRYEYIIAGPPLEQISIAEPLAKNGETCLSPQAWDYVKACVVEGPPLEERRDFHLLLRMDESKYTFPTIKHAAMENDDRSEKQFKMTHLPIIRRYIPSAVYKQIECGTLTYVNEMRNISVIFISGSGLDPMSKQGPGIAQELMASVQNYCYQHEGTLNKFLIDDKGMLFLLVFGLPPLVHTDDPTRAVLACFDMVKVFKRLQLIGKFGVTTGRNYCGVCGSARRMEYTVLGDSVNLAARLMANAPPLGIYCDAQTKIRSTTEIIFNALAPIKVKGKANPISIFQPVKKEVNTAIGLTINGKISFPWHQNAFGGVSAGGLSVGEFQEGVIRLCSIKTWTGILEANRILNCTSFRKEIHSDQALQMPQKGQPPAKGPFKTGGVIVVEGPTGIGKIEIAEHMVTHAAVTFRTFPVFGTMGPRPGDSVRLGCELLRSTIGVFRWSKAGSGLPDDDFEALKQLVPQKNAGRLPLLQQVLVKDKADLSKERSKELLDVSLNVAIELLTQFAEMESVVMVMQFEYGTSLFPKNSEDQNIFWETITILYENFIKNPSKTSKPRVMMLVCRESNAKNPAVAHAAKDIEIVKEGKEDIQKSALVKMSGLDEANLAEYMSSYLNLPDSDQNLIPSPLRYFVIQVTSGNPLYTRETIDQLREHHIQVNQGAGGQVRNVECKDIDKVNVSHWGHTAMVGNTVCLIEALDPLEAAVLKMSTCFAGPFTLGDLAASTCSRWAEATYFDFLRLFQAIRKLVVLEIIDRVDAPQDDLRAETAAQSPNARYIQYFQTQSVLIRSVGGAMVLEAQKKSVKRQALIDRALSRELPAKMAILAIKRSAQHIPWYYEQAFRRML
mmetsp:Transcript_22433/g.40471  ORF Transcript_22433/g.40471 Transcript_22433/m.40471 type:complete len:1073 (-) Transcript_22433:145-3363(-)|eukprot:CAMPEP_0197655836 /NCGR_PEP_ID=MMETSP1338-20131121/39698_1 /TAXON_ID=43686 ORGANISM="Pelagodinium beii, Strain RCC1491" /NCGR_SAMPLE_ID=MMETSP1338 /ASSEMBLY_ACC=CAM_ASM_000754 /LENGTH=1072 /DNA_ID=CAMNT_0043231563 /DNA_START=60 /DNA_END=3278 /DNA_ORIENTATION=-